MARCGCEHPEDITGRVIQVGDRVACACLASRSAILMVGTVTNIDSYKGIQVEEELRTYGLYNGGKGKKRRYGFPNRLVVLK